MHRSLIDAIHSEFPVGQPPSRPITSHRCEECDNTDRLFGGRIWTEVAADFPLYCHDTFPLLNPWAKAYYMPAYMCIGLQSPEYISGSSVADAMESGELNAASFNKAQRAAAWDWAVAFWSTLRKGGPPSSVVEAWCPREIEG
jgi:hypothetical protein